MIPSLRDLERSGCVDRTDVALARVLGRLAGAADEAEGILLAVALASRMVAAGHVCLDLADPPLLGELRPVGPDQDDDLEVWSWPEPATWEQSLRGTRLVDDATEPDDDASSDRRPLVLDAQGRLYLRRYWEHERALARALIARAAACPEIDARVLEAGLDRLFPEPGNAAVGVALQRRAVESALRRRLCVISGGPGTGKTSAAARILVLAVEQARALGRSDPRIVLVAPTGKAAAALTAALAKNLAGLDCDETVRDAVPRTASTIHRTLGSRRGVGAGFSRNADHPLEVELVVVDEASMVDLALMRRLVDAVPDDARLVMMGDADQLASVEAGAVLADICGRDDDRARADDTPVARSIVRLEHSYRFASTSGIGVLARAVNAGRVDEVHAVLADEGMADVTWIERKSSGWPAEVQALVDAGFSDLVAARDARAGLEALGRFRVLCPHRAGPLGIDDLNARLPGRWRGAGFEPILIERNDRVLGLFNGDMGLRESRRQPGRSAARVFFPGGHETGGDDMGETDLRSLSELRLPPHSACWAMSVHKSQGSEFDEVLIVLPERSSPLLTREMLYTAITRARERVVIWGPRALLAECIERRVERRSGLCDALWAQGASGVGV